MPYQPDLNKALQELREQVFESGRYYRREPREIREEDFADMPEEVREQVPIWIEHEKSLPEATTIETLIARNGPDGTHTIIDMNRVVDTPPQPTTLRQWLAENWKPGKIPDANDQSAIFFPRIGSISPLSKHQLIILFGTTEPSRQMVERAGAERRLDDLRDCGEGFYVVVYGDGVPREIYFAGCSGD